MNQIFKIVLIVTFAAVSCSKEVVDADDMPKILADIYMADRYMLNSPANIQKADSLFIYEPILNKYGYTVEDMIYTMNHYLPRPQKLKLFFTEAKAILEKRELNVSNKIAANAKKDSLLAPIRKIIKETDSLKELDSYERSVRWIIAPEVFPNWRINMPDSLKMRFELPKLEQWWLNNLTTKSISHLYYEKNSGAIHLPIKLPPDLQRFSRPQL
jgi:hypothetical protein